MKKKLIISASAVGIFVFLTVIITGGIMLYKNSSDTPDNITQELTDITRNFEEVQNEFAVDYPCGVTDFDSPYVKALECSPEKMKKGVLVDVVFSGYVGDINGGPIIGVKIKANDSELVETDSDGKFNLNIKVDSIKKSINVIGDKFGYSPIRDVINAEVINGKIISLGKYKKSFMMRGIEVRDIVLEENKEITIKSDKYAGVSITIPANGLENYQGEVVTGDITGEITYLNPNKAADSLITPGFSGNVRQMIGINSNGQQVTLASEGMVFFHFKQEGSDEILQPRRGVEITITQPMLEGMYEILTDSEIQAGAAFTEGDKKYYAKLGIHAGMDEDEKFKILKSQNIVASNYWYYNERIGLWEEWPVKNLECNTDTKLCTMKVPRFY